MSIASRAAAEMSIASRAVATLVLLYTTSAMAQFGGTCQGGMVSDVAALANDYPPLFTIANIVAGDTVAQNLFNSITGPALAYAPSNMVNGSPVAPASYNAGTDNTCYWTDSQCTTPKVPGLPDDAHTCPPPSSWGLSFDDGPTCYHGPLYELLIQNKQPATLFYIGSNLASYPDEARYAFNSGFDICVHTWSHKYTTSLTNEQVFAELYYTKKLIKDVLGVTTRCWRPPYGDVDDRVRTIATALELYTFIWDADTADWSATSNNFPAVETNYNNIINGNYANQGTMPLTHELTQYTVAIFDAHYNTIKQRFSRVVSAAACYNITNPYAETTAPVYPNFVADYGLQTLQAPATAGTSGNMVFAGQDAFFESLGDTPPPPVASTVSSAVPSSTAAPSTAAPSVAAPSVAAPTTSTAASVPSVVATSSAIATLSPVLVASQPVTDKKIALGAIIAAAAGGVALAVLIAVFVLCARKRGWMCFGSSRRSKPPNYLRTLPSDLYSEKWARSDHALLSGASSPSLFKASVSDVNLPLSSYRDLRYSSASQVDILRYADSPSPPVTPTLAYDYPAQDTQARSPRRSAQPRTRQSMASIQYVRQG